MANYANLLATIAANIYTNNNNEVTAAMVKTAVDQMVASLGAGYQFMDIATPATTPGNTDVKQFYIASEAGIYTDFGGLEVYDNEVAVIYGSGSSWSKKVTGAATIASVQSLEGIFNDIKPLLMYDIVTGKVYNVYTNAEASVANGAYFKVDVSGADSVVVNGVQHGSSSYPIITFYDAGDNVLSVVSDAFQTFTDYEVAVPAGAAYGLMNVNTDYPYGCGQIAVEKEAAKDLFQSTKKDVYFNDMEIHDGKVLNVYNNSEVSITNGLYAKFSIAGKDVIYVTGSQHGSNNYPIITIYDSADNILSVISKANTGFTNYAVPVPADASYAIMNVVKSYEWGCHYKEFTLERGPIYYKKDSNESIYVASKYGDDKDIVVALIKKTVNQLLDFWQAKVLSNDKPYPCGNIFGGVEIWGSSSDWHGPFIVRSVNNQDGDNINSHYWTGGAHGSDNNSYSGTATARCINIKLTADGNEISEGEGYCSNLKITWTNMVQAYTTTKADGTGREVLKENHELVFDGNEWHSYVEVIALEDVVFEKYYGFQYVAGTVYPKVRFIGAVNRLEYLVANAAESGDNYCHFIKGYGDDHEINLQLDNQLDLGKREHYEGTAAALVRDYGKGYFYVICGDGDSYANYAVNDGELIAMRGTYTFKPHTF